MQFYSLFKYYMEPGYALLQAHSRKFNLIGEACRAEGIDFVPLPVEVLGGWSKSASLQLTRLSRALAGRNGRDEKEVKRHLF